MKFVRDGPYDLVEFSSGHRRGHYGGIFSVWIDDGGPCIFYGHDGGFWDPSEVKRPASWERHDALSKDDLLELCQEQLNAWSAAADWFQKNL